MFGFSGEKPNELQARMDNELDKKLNPGEQRRQEQDGKKYHIDPKTGKPDKNRPKSVDEQKAEQSEKQKERQARRDAQLDDEGQGMDWGDDGVPHEDDPVVFRKSFDHE